MYLLAIASATRSILIANSYFVPNTLAVSMLVEARRRGVDVEIIVPGPILDAKMVRRASRAKWGPLLEAGVRIYEYQPTMYHTKVMIVDDYWVSVGSTNFDNRSFRLNDEANLNVIDEAFARAQAEVFAEDRARSQQVTLEEWRRRPLRGASGRTGGEDGPTPAVSPAGTPYPFATPLAPSHRLADDRAGITTLQTG